MTLKITTNNHERPIVRWHELTDAEREEFDYIANDGPDARDEFQGVRFRKSVYDLGQFERIPHTIAMFEADGADNAERELLNWHGCQTQSAFDAILVRFKLDYDTVIVGYATW